MKQHHTVNPRARQKVGRRALGVQGAVWGRVSGSMAMWAMQAGYVSEEQGDGQIGRGDAQLSK